MTDITVSRGATSVTLPLLAEGGQLLIARDAGKPNATVRANANVDPQSRDHDSANDQLSLFGLFRGSSAYADAKSLAEDLIKPQSGGTALQVDATNVSGFDTVLEIGVPAKQALQLEYLPGRSDLVVVALSAPVVNTTIG